MSEVTIAPYDVADYLRTPEDMAAYLEACIEICEGDASFVAKALGDIARAKGMSQVAREAGVSRESLYRSLSGGRSPNLDTFLRVINALGITLRVEPTKPSKKAPSSPQLHRQRRAGLASPPR